MANPRQRRKSRSSSHKPISHSRHAKRNLKKMPPISGPKVLQDTWDKKKTVRQNYAALGLIHTLNPMASGGVEPSESQSLRDNEVLPHAIPQVLGSEPSIPMGFGRVVRDETGHILRIELGEEESQDHFTGVQTPDADMKVIEKWTTNLGGNARFKPLSREPCVIKTLESISTTIHHNFNTLSLPLSNVGPRHSSAGEVAYLRRLVSKYGEDVGQMSVDVKLNPEQRTAGELRRALRRAGLRM